MVACGFFDPTPNDPTKVLKAGDTMTGDLILSGANTDLTVGGRTIVNYGTNFTVDVGEGIAAVATTGVVSGGALSINALNPLAIDISPMIAYIVDSTTDPINPKITRISTPTLTGVLSGPSLTRTVTWWSMDVTGNLIQSGLPPTYEQRRTTLVLGTSSQTGGVIFGVNESAVLLPQSINQLYDLYKALGPFHIDGNVITPNGVNLQINKSAGTVFATTFSQNASNNPHVTSTPAQTPVTFRYVTQGAGTGPPPYTNVIDPTKYDVGGVVTPVGGGSNSTTIQRVWLIGTSVVNNQILVQYGQTVHASISAAIDRIGAGTYLVNPTVNEIGALIGYIVVVRSATNLSDTTQAVFIHAGKFSTP